MTVPAFGTPWSAKGESRQRNQRTPLAWVPGAGDGVLFVQFGEGPDNRRWVLMSEWDGWVKATGGHSIEPQALDLPWDDPPATPGQEAPA